jgi:hypothetical protein
MEIRRVEKSNRELYQWGSGGLSIVIGSYINGDQEG